MDLRTKGEQPFGQLVKRQLFAQAADGSKSADDYPNQGRKVLIFSDGRQKAARLAKAIPDEVEADAFRELLARGYAKLGASRRERLQLQKAYAPFIAACADAKVGPFSGNDAQQVRNDVRQYIGTFDGDLEIFIDDGPANSPLAFRTQLYRQACGGLYSFRFICAGWIAPLRRYLKPLFEKYGEAKQGQSMKLRSHGLTSWPRIPPLTRILSGDPGRKLRGLTSQAGRTRVLSRKRSRPC